MIKISSDVPTMYMQVSPKIEIEGKVCKLKKSLYCRILDIEFIEYLFDLFEAHLVSFLIFM